MLLSMAFAVGLGSALLEIWFCRAIPVLHKIIKSNQAVDIAFSFGLSYILSGGQGVTAVLAGVVGTVITTIWWKNEDWVVPLYTKTKTETIPMVKAKAPQYIQTSKDLIKMIGIFITIITFPIRLCRAILHFCTAVHTRSTTALNRMRSLSLR